MPDDPTTDFRPHLPDRESPDSPVNDSHTPLPPSGTSLPTDAGPPFGTPFTKESSPTNDPDSSAANRRAFLRNVAWAGSIAGIGGLAGVTFNNLKASGESNKKAATPPLGAEFTYDVSRFQSSDPTLLRYQEIARFPVGLERARNLTVAPDGAILVCGTGGIRKFSPKGETLLSIPLDMPAVSIALRPSGEILAGQAGKIARFDASGAAIGAWSDLSENLLPTSIAVSGENIYIADAGNRVVLKLDASGKKTGVIGARDPARNITGFIVPSPYFCVRMGHDGLLRVANPGEHRIEAYTSDGDLELSWGSASFNVAGFCGCCNPVSFDIFPDGSFVTCEKGLPRVKLYDASGEFTGLVAGPEAFPEYLKAANAGTPDSLGSGIYAAINPAGQVLVLDVVGGTVRIMQRKEQNHG